MFFFKKGKQVQHEISLDIVDALDIYKAKENEPESSVMDSLDYDFAIQKYPKTDFRFRFVQEYMKYIQTTYGVEVYNCKFERPETNSIFLNFCIYFWEDDLTLQFRIENTNNHFVKAFYKILKDYPLPAVTEQLRLQVITRNIRRVMFGKILDLTWRDIHLSIKDRFPEVADLSFWSVFYVFIKKEVFHAVIEDTSQLTQIKEYCFNMAKTHDVHQILDFEQFQIRIDNYDNYQSIGGGNYFNSDYMINCLLY